MKVLLYDNYDSFTWNLVHYLQIAGLEVDTVMNDEAGPDHVLGGGYDGIVLSPGPCTPADAGMLLPVLSAAAGRMPVLGICLGHQAIGMHFGWQLSRAAVPVHGKARLVSHRGTGLFKGLPDPMQAGRYHSLIVKPDAHTASPLMIEATCGEEVMAVRHQTLPIWGVQFHPESILTPQGQQLINNWAASLG